MRSRPPGSTRPQAPDAKGGPRAGWPLGSPPPRPAPGLKEPLASGAARRKSPRLAPQTRPSAAPRPRSRPPPSRLLRSRGFSPAEPALRPTAGVRQGRSLRRGQRPLPQREEGVAPCKTERACWSGFWGVTVRLRKLSGWLEATWGGASHVAPVQPTEPDGDAQERNAGGRLRGCLGLGRACQALSPFFCNAGNCGSVNQVTHPESDGIVVRRHMPHTHKLEPGLLDRPV